MVIQLLKTIAVLAAVLALIFALAYLLRKLKLTGRLGEAGNEGWRVLAVKHLGPRRQVFVLEVGSRLLLIGVTDRSMTPLMDITEPADCDALREALGRKKHSVPSFQEFLRKADS